MLPLKKTEDENPSVDERSEIEEAWIRESERRLSAYESGHAKGIPAKEVHDFIDKCIQKARKEP